MITGAGDAVTTSPVTNPRGSSRHMMLASLSQTKEIYVYGR